MTTAAVPQVYTLAVPPAPWYNRVLLLAMLLLALSCIAGVSPPVAPGEANLERSVKAAFLYKFLGYIEFPSDPGPQLAVGVLGADDVAEELTQLSAGRSVNNRPVQIKVLKEGDSPAGLQLLFIGADAARPLQAIKAAAQNGVLSVTETDSGLQLGSVINFRMVEERVRFEVSLPAAERSNVKLSSRLLSVAYHVQKAGQ
jgi:hypothetical protein